jgi:hypothetical protein
VVTVVRDTLKKQAILPSETLVTTYKTKLYYKQEHSRRLYIYIYIYIKAKKDKAVPLLSIEAHLGDRRYSSYSFLTSALEGGEWSASRPGRALPSGKEPPVPTVQEAGWAPQPVWTQRLEEKSSASVGDRTLAVQSVVRHYSD